MWYMGRYSVRGGRLRASELGMYMVRYSVRGRVPAGICC